ncbi:type II toxin-antitoxin system tRNA(fMet)-specific endonuclease VapC [Halanaerobium congolense]|jgi:tRNA(fMet)-specific endonuclease VapC|uniref:Ribonuclease VapC n=1 Tax=Halanaerobium congolense TaxID=54121 RepID=A0A1G6MUU1_9FIRM|nr:type II toxin-antitoxin system VapC family toxin [Halanaerobium congolense]PXV61267.1 tRNA(fMet)-specific endonuclease VapC [Halanaerobium congolense]TDP07733.1 tRNA(fMet)-specific endonuclease VapC [Halanaerobium congolense]TDX43677.1 tRNA(fMet)-specific endonuclease VapC [Halanaerobium congolense]SDC58967.1 tRNA(fMet)-specific endonuclease VapC [Halanaerobium congolense]
MKYMLDTNICIYIIKEKPKKVLDKFQTCNIGDICISMVTFAELQYGVEKSQYKDKNQTALASFLGPIEILPFEQNAAIKYGSIRADLENQGRIRGAYDLMIAAHAIAENLILVTNNTKEFKRITDLSLENWAK